LIVNFEKLPTKTFYLLSALLVRAVSQDDVNCFMEWVD